MQKLFNTLNSNHSNFKWLCFEQLIPYEFEDSCYWYLTELGIIRFCFEYSPENKISSTLRIWLPFNEWPLVQQQKLVYDLTSQAKTFGFVLPSCKWIEVENEDWSLSWKKEWTPDPIGSSILILPAWLEVPFEYSDRNIIRLDPGSAFGTGSHPSTRLCIEELENDPPIGKTVADLGCGSGILTLTALKLGAECTFSVDTDSLAVSATKINFALNDLPESLLNVSLGSINELAAIIPHEKIDLMYCNILAPVIKSLGPSFDRIIRDKGEVVLSGLLIEQIKELENFFDGLCWKVLDIKKKNNWALMKITQRDISN